MIYNESDIFQASISGDIDLQYDLLEFQDIGVWAESPHGLNFP